ncbi:FHA domain-containing protein (plasmid) [Singulisphaera sp. Ch08]|uniref:FHA domain-containing protein n=1 Tax=Singulisphaera sp. Ch08 TaxID=3120278 RepID=A0AAU7CSK8_9BACT
MISFLDASGAGGPLQWAIECRGSAVVERFTFDQPFLVVGRNPVSDLHLPHPEVSDRHAYLQLVGGRLACVDLGSDAGTYLDGCCQRFGWVDPGGTIRIGPYRLRLASEDCIPKAAGSETTRQPTMALELSHRSIRSSSCSVTEDLILVGSSADCQVRLLDLSVSNVHCALIRTSKGNWLVDLLGRGGITINGTKTRIGRIVNGDEFRLGNSRVRLPSDRTADLAADEAHKPIGSVGSSSIPAVVSAADLRPLLSGLTPETAEIAESLLVPLANQFGMMQQHLFDRLQQAERERFQALATFQNEQFAALREELEQLRELRQEIDEMRGELIQEDRTSNGRTRTGKASVTRPRLGAATTPDTRDRAQALPPPEASSVLRISIGESSSL